jgi:hypothetical protein
VALFTKPAWLTKWLAKFADNEFQNIREGTFREQFQDMADSLVWLRELNVRMVKGAVYPVPYIDNLGLIPPAYRILGMEALARNGTDSATGGAGVIEPPITYQLIRDSAGDIDALVDEQPDTEATVKARWVRVSGTAQEQIDSFPPFEQEDRQPSYQVGDRFSFQLPGGEWRLFQVKVAQGYLAALPTGEDSDPNYAPFAPLAGGGGGAEAFADLLGDPLANAQLAALLTALAPKASPAFSGTPTAATAPLGTNTAQLATTAFVTAAITALVNGAPLALDTLKELADALGNSNSALASLLTNVSGRLSIASNLADVQSPSAAKANLGLGNVNNTSDASKPISTATAAALDKWSPAFSPLTVSSNVAALDCSSKFLVNRTLALAGNVTLNFSNLVSGASGTLLITHDNTTTSYTLATNVSSKGALYVTQFNNAVTELSWLYDGTTLYWLSKAYPA